MCIVHRPKYGNLSVSESITIESWDEIIDIGNCVLRLQNLD